MVLNGASIYLENVQCRTPLYYIKNAELKKTLKKIAREKIDGDMASWEEPGEDSTENESGADFPAGNQQKIDKPEIEGKEVGLKVGDLVAITLDSETLHIMQQMGGQEWLPEMGNLYGKVAKVTGINSSGNAEVTYPERKEQPFTFNPHVLNKVPRLGKGDRVQINKDLTFVRNLHENSLNGWIDGMEKLYGKVAKVTGINSSGNAEVTYPERKEQPFIFNPDVLNKVWS
ncbi:uncharacterized protein LOC105446583 [Strongylocentrotus purpuratus]|uniref:Mind bomb SH3 repeat domain-containing protein n=1 Tax=Strongylocentrotus purpuratus TaxID=7668 RepID=A0A7M7SZW1_STRPU|nr:uncharacterized protein LOC105446583 [Strongylocentrotus purpuratus]